MIILQYLVQFLGAGLVVLGYLSARAMKNTEGRRSYWTRIDESKARSELPEYIMSLASRGMDGLVGVSALLCAFGLALGLSFPNLIYDNIEGVIEAGSVATGVLGAQIIGFIIFFCLGLLTYVIVETERSGSLISTNQDLLQNVASKVLFPMAALGIVFIVFKYSTEGFMNVQRIIDPIFSSDIEVFFSDIILNFAATTVILSLPTLMVVLVVFILKTFVEEKFPGKINSTPINSFFYVSFIFVIGFVGSIFYTLSSGAVGNILQGQSTYPVTFQLVMANAVFDGLTLYTTVSLMRWASASWRVRGALSKVEESLHSFAHVREIFYSIPFSHEALRDENHTSHLNALIKELEKVETETQLLKFLSSTDKDLVQFTSVTKDKLLSGLSDLANIFTYGELILLDRALFRTGVQKDYEIPLLGYGRSQRNSKRFDVKQSWIAHSLKCLEEDVSSIKLDPDKETTGTNKDLKGSTEYTGDQAEAYEFQADKNYVATNALFTSTWSAINKDRKLFKHRPFIAITFDIVLASAFAYCSMFFGLVGKAEHLSVEYLNKLFVGGYSLGEFSSIGPLFWIMHTTFIPSLFLVVLLMFLLFSGYAISPLVNWIGRKMNLVDRKKYGNSYNVSANLSLAKTGAIITAIGTILMIINRVLNVAGSSAV